MAMHKRWAPAERRALIIVLLVVASVIAMSVLLAVIEG